MVEGYGDEDQFLVGWSVGLFKDVFKWILRYLIIDYNFVY